MKGLSTRQIRVWAASVAALLALHGLARRFTELSLVPLPLWAGLALLGLYVLFRTLGEAQPGCVGKGGLWALAVCFSLCVVTGCVFRNGLSFAGMDLGAALLYFWCVVALSPVFRCLFAALFFLLERWGAAERGEAPALRPGRAALLWLCAFLFILACWVPVWLAYFPGLWNYDPWQIAQYVEHSFNKHHPLIHTLLLGSCYSFGVARGNGNLGLILYESIQLTVMAGIFAYVYVYLQGRVHSRAFRVLTLLFFALFPVHPILALSTTKDVLFSGLTVLSLVLALQCLERREQGGRSRLLPVCLACSLDLMLLFRNNAFYALLLFLLLELVLVLKKRVGKRVLLFALCCALLYLGSDAALTAAVSSGRGAVREMLSLPSQQFGRVYFVASVDGEGTVTDPESRELVASFYDMNEAHYEPYIADGMKDHLRPMTVSDIPAYIRAFFTLLGRYPLASLDSFVYVTQGNWDINDVSHAHMYTSELEGLEGYLQTCLHPGYGIEPDSRLPALKALLEHAFTDNAYREWPLASLLFAPALYFWLLVLCTVVFRSAGRWQELGLAGYFWAFFLTVLAGPCALIRYTYPLIVCAPVLLAAAARALRDHPDK